MTSSDIRATLRRMIDVPRPRCLPHPRFATVLLASLTVLWGCEGGAVPASDTRALGADGEATPGPCQQDSDCGPGTDGGLCVTHKACVSGACLTVQAVSCAGLSADACFVGACLPATGACYLTAAPTGTACTLEECNETAGTCADGQCRAPTGDTPGCTDENPCTGDLCVAGVGCRHDAVALGTPCTSADPCIDGASCDAAACVGGHPRQCDDENQCTEDTCQPGVGCRFDMIPAYKKQPCEDGNTCAGPDYCNGGGNCASEFYHQNDGKACDDHDPCSLTTQCQSGVCRLVALDGQAESQPAGTECPIAEADGRCFERAECRADGICEAIPMANGVECPNGCGSAPYAAPGKCLDGWCKCY